MAKNRTAKSCFESKYGGGWITAAQWLAEMACERQSETTLSNRFWQNPPWDKMFRVEVDFANQLLTKFSIEAIRKAWVSYQGRRVRSLKAPFFKPMIELEQRTLDLQAVKLQQATAPEVVNIMETPRPVKRAEKSIREKLADNGPNTQGSSNTNK